MRPTPRKFAILALTVVASCERRDDVRVVPAGALVLRESRLFTVHVPSETRTPAPADTISRHTDSVPSVSIAIENGRSTTRTDSARGTVTLTGSCNGGFTMLSLGDDKAVILDGSRVPLQQLSGVELVVFGQRRTGPFRWPVQYVDSFLVRASEGVPALDGTLRREDGRDVLELRDGQRLTISRLPDRLTKGAGMRVWLAGPLDAPIASGVIDPSFKLQCAE